MEIITKFQETKIQETNKPQIRNLKPRIVGCNFEIRGTVYIVCFNLKFYLIYLVLAIWILVLGSWFMVLASNYLCACLKIP